MMQISDDLDDEFKLLFNRRFLTQRDIYQDLLDFIVARTNSDVGYLHLYDENKQDITLNVWSKSVYGACTTSTLSHYPLKEAGIWADAIRQKITVVHNQYLSEKSKTKLPEGHFQIIRHMSTPVFWQNKIVAIVGVGNKLEPYEQEDIEKLEHLSKMGWLLILDRLEEYQLRNETKGKVLQGKKPEELMLTMVGAIAKAIELRDEYTSHHQSNVAIISEAIAEQLGLPEGQVYGTRLGASVHDIGKLAIPSEILTKPSTLNAIEFAMVKEHSSLGAKIFRGIDLPWPILEIIEQHHERMDGSGYPKGLVGNSICLEARIVAVADIYDAMASDRPYRPAPGTADAIKIITEGKGIKFDAYVVDAFLNVINEGLLDDKLLYGHSYRNL